MRIRTKQICLAIVAAGTAVTALVAACKATVDARDIIHDETLTTPQKAVRIAGSYALAVGGAVVSALAINEYHKTSTEESAAKEFLNEELKGVAQAYREEVAKNTSIKKENQMWESANIRLVKSTDDIPFTITDIDYNSGDMLFYDQLHKCWYVKNKDVVYKAEKAIIERMRAKDVVPINEYYKLIDLSKTDYGKYLNWSCAPDAVPESIFDYSVHKRDEDGLIYTVVLYKLVPTRNKKGDEAA